MDSLPYELCLIIGSYIPKRKPLFKIHSTHLRYHLIFADSIDDAIMLITDKIFDIMDPLKGGIAIRKFIQSYCKVIIASNEYEYLEFKKILSRFEISKYRERIMSARRQLIWRNKEDYIIQFKDKFTIEEIDTTNELILE